MARDAICCVSCGIALGIVPLVLAPLVASLQTLFFSVIACCTGHKVSLEWQSSVCQAPQFQTHLQLWIHSFNASFVDSGHHLCRPQNRQTNGQAVKWSVLIPTPLPVNFKTLRVIAVIKWRHTVANRTWLHAQQTTRNHYIIAAIMQEMHTSKLDTWKPKLYALQSSVSLMRSNWSS